MLFSIHSSRDEHALLTYDSLFHLKRRVPSPLPWFCSNANTAQLTSSSSLSSRSLDWSKLKTWDSRKGKDFGGRAGPHWYSASATVSAHLVAKVKNTLFQYFVRMRAFVWKVTELKKFLLYSYDFSPVAQIFILFCTHRVLHCHMRVISQLPTAFSYPPLLQTSPS